MAVAAGVLNETRRRTLEAVCDTYVPSIEVDTDDQVMREYMARSASDLGVAAQLEGLMAQAMMPEDIEAMGGLLDALAAQGLVDMPVEARLQVLNAVRASSPEAKLGINQLKGLTLLFFYSLPDEQGR